MRQTQTYTPKQQFQLLNEAIGHSEQQSQNRVSIGQYAALSHEAYKVMTKLILKVRGQQITFLVDLGATES